MVSIGQEDQPMMQSEDRQLPLGFMDKFFRHLAATEGGADTFSMMLSSLGKLSPFHRVGNASQNKGNTNNNTEKKNAKKKSTNNNNKRNDDKTMTANDIHSLQHFIFSNITDTTFVPWDLIYQGKMIGITQMTLTLAEDQYKDLVKMKSEGKRIPPNVFQFAQYLPKMTKLKRLNIMILNSLTMGSFYGFSPGREGVKEPWDPFQSLVTRITLPSLENLIINDSHYHITLSGVANTLIKYWSLPALCEIDIPYQIFATKDRVQIKALLDFFSRMPHLSQLLSLWDYASLEFIQEFLKRPQLLSQISSLRFWSNTTPTNRDLILKSPHLTSLKDLELRGSFKDPEDFDRTSDWLFKMEWMRNVTSLTFCPPTIYGAQNMATSPYLLNVESLNLITPNDASQDCQPGVIVLKSPNLSKLKRLHLPDCPPDYMAVITSSPHLSNLEEFCCYNPPDTTLLLIAESKTLKNLRGIEFRGERFDTPTGASHLISLSQSPNIMNLTKLDGIHLRSTTVEALKAWVSSQYVSNLTQLDVSSRGFDLNSNPSEWTPLLFSNPAWSNLNQLDLSGNGLDDDDIKLLAESPHLANLTSLNLDNNPHITDQGLLFLAQSPHLANLEIFRFNTQRIQPFSNEALIQFFKSPYIRKLSLLHIACHPSDNLEALEYLFKNPDIFFNGDGRLVEKLPEFVCRLMGNDDSDRFQMMAVNAPFIFYPTRF